MTCIEELVDRTMRKKKYPAVLKEIMWASWSRSAHSVDVFAGCSTFPPQIPIRQWTLSLQEQVESLCADQKSAHTITLSRLRVNKALLDFYPNDIESENPLIYPRQKRKNPVESWWCQRRLSQMDSWPSQKNLKTPWCHCFFCQGSRVYRLFCRPLYNFYLEQRKIHLESSLSISVCHLSILKTDGIRCKHMGRFFQSWKCLVYLYIFLLLYRTKLSLGSHLKVISSGT